jgi:hypothetical protein
MGSRHARDLTPKRSRASVGPFGRAEPFAEFAGEGLAEEAVGIEPVSGLNFPLIEGFIGNFRKKRVPRCETWREKFQFRSRLRGLPLVFRIGKIHETSGNPIFDTGISADFGRSQTWKLNID